MKHTVSLEIGGTRYRLSADAEEEHLRKLGQIVNDRIEALGNGADRASAAQKLVVVALGLADDLLSLENRQRVLQQTTKDIVQSAIDRIDQRLELGQNA
ncbi:MAG: cell division protein ZapA [Myxococcales bacterium]|nr:MAG: cell division protein ZapA [Myxococcales bacterium]